MRIRVLGAGGGEVTGSAYHVETSRASVLVDAGLFQGGADLEDRNVVPPGLDLRRLDAVLLTHAHLDHTGRLPLLFKEGYEGPVYATAATVDLALIILKDTAKLQAQDVMRLNRKRQRADEPPLEPLYGAEHVEPILERSRVVELDGSTEVAEGIRVRFLEAGHLLGSASLELTLEDAGERKVVVFSGDLGPTMMPIIREFRPPSGADVVFLESTYGDRDHRPYPATIAEFSSIVGSIAATRGKILVPTFAIGRAQQLLYHLALVFRDGAVHPFPVYLDSPMAIEATRVYLRHPELFDSEMQALNRGGLEPLRSTYFRPTVTADESRKLNEIEGPCVILAGAGMCTGGRILHHLKQNLWKKETHVLIVGFQARGSLGRSLVEGVRMITIHGERIAVRGSIHTLGGFSAHAGQTDLLKWFSAMAGSHPRVVLTHGEDGPRTVLADQIRERHRIDALRPAIGEEIVL